MESAKASPEELPNPYCKVRLDDFISGREIKYDIFVKLGDGRYVAVARTGEDLSPDRIESYRASGTEYVYLRREDFLKYVGMNVKIVRAIKSSQISNERKTAFLKHTVDNVFEQAFVNKLDQRSFESASAVMREVVQVLAQDDDFYHLLESIKSVSDYLYLHSTAVSLYSLMMARRLEWISTPTQFKVAMSAMFHDIGKREIDQALLSKPKEDLDAAGRKAVDSHVQRGVQILGQIQGVPEDILMIVSQHELRVDLKTGMAKFNRIHPLARLIAVADDFAKLVLPMPGTKQEKLTAAEAFAKLEKQSLLYDARMLAALKISIR